MAHPQHQHSTQHSTTHWAHERGAAPPYPPYPPNSPTNNKPHPVKTPSLMTRFELTRLTGFLLLGRDSRGPSPSSDTHTQTLAAEGTDALIRRVARDIVLGDTDAIIRRPLPDGGYEDVHVSNLRRDHLLAGFDDTRGGVDGGKGGKPAA